MSYIGESISGGVDLVLHEVHGDSLGLIEPSALSIAGTHPVAHTDQQLGISQKALDMGTILEKKKLVCITKTFQLISSSRFHCK